ncbi:MAG TPA: DUF3592 domain-containing protein [Pseudonocardiaceae bacterium]|nr:DUF3592 domain-containing protein [Pseudonocardiaceae bacterium]
MAKDLALAEADGRGEPTARPAEPAAPPAEPAAPPAEPTAPPAEPLDCPPVAAGPSRRRRVTAVVVLVLGCVIRALCLLVLYGCWHDDHDIDAHLGRTDADVLSVVFNRTAVRFVTPDGTIDIPPEGVLYPAGLAAGERVKVEYDTLDPDLVRVAGRDFTLAFLPIGSTIAGTWIVAGPLLWWLRRPKRG